MIRTLENLQDETRQERRAANQRRRNDESMIVQKNCDHADEASLMTEQRSRTSHDQAAEMQRHLHRQPVFDSYDINQRVSGKRGETRA